MININSVQGAAIPPVNPVSPATAAVPAAPAANVSDVVEISTVAQLAAKVHDLPDVRADLVQRVKDEIAAGTYETPERLEIAVSRLMEELM